MGFFFKGFPLFVRVTKFLNFRSVNDSDSQIFVPFLAEVKVGQFDEDSDSLAVNRFQEETQVLF